MTHDFQPNETAGGRRWELDADRTASVPLQIPKGAAEQHPAHILRTSLEFHTMNALYIGKVI